MKRYKLNEVRAHKYIQIPKELFVSDRYGKLSNDSKILYGYLLDRMELSKKNEWVNENNEVYLIFTREEVQRLLGISNKTSTKIFRELKDYGLIEEDRQGLNKPNLIYIGHINYDNNELRNCNNYNSKSDNKVLIESVELGLEDENELHTSNTNISNTEISKTNGIYKEEETLSGGDLDCDILECYKKYISKDVSDVEFDILVELEHTYNKELTMKAIKTSCEYNKKNLWYIRALVEDWCNKALNDSNLVDSYRINWKNDNKKVKEVRERKIAVQANQEHNDFDLY